MKIYELTYIISPEITLEEAETKGKEIEIAITSREGLILKQLNPTAKTFSYPIGKNASGFFGVIEFQAEPEKLPELNEWLQNKSMGGEKIIRHMVIVKEAAELKKERRVRGTIKVKPDIITEIEKKEEKVEEKMEKKPVKEKVELKDIEQSLDELLS